MAAWACQGAHHSVQSIREEVGTDTLAHGSSRDSRAVACGTSFLGAEEVGIPEGVEERKVRKVLGILPGLEKGYRPRLPVFQS